MTYEPIYPQLYALLQGYFYGADAVLTGDQTLVLTLLSTIGCIMVIALPFMVCWRFCSWIFGR